jgi:hypothetical protein
MRRPRHRTIPADLSPFRRCGNDDSGPGTGPTADTADEDELVVDSVDKADDDTLTEGNGGGLSAGGMGGVGGVGGKDLGSGFNLIGHRHVMYPGILGGATKWI